jgi:hypothetical protein
MRHVLFSFYKQCIFYSPASAVHATTRLVLPYKKHAIKKHVKKGAQVRPFCSTSPEKAEKRSVIPASNGLPPLPRCAVQEIAIEFLGFTWGRINARIAAWQINP